MLADGPAQAPRGPPRRAVKYYRLTKPPGSFINAAWAAVEDHGCLLTQVSTSRVGRPGYMLGCAPCTKACFGSYPTIDPAFFPDTFVTLVWADDETEGTEP